MLCTYNQKAEFVTTYGQGTQWSLPCMLCTYNQSKLTHRNVTAMQCRAYPWQTTFIKKHSGSAVLLQLCMASLSL